MVSYEPSTITTAMILATAFFLFEILCKLYTCRLMISRLVRGSLPHFSPISLALSPISPNSFFLFAKMVLLSTLMVKMEMLSLKKKCMTEAAVLCENTRNRTTFSILNNFGFCVLLTH